MDLSRIPEPLRSKLKEQLEHLPAEVRRKLETQMSRLPPEQLEAVLAKSAPMLERLAGKPAQAARQAGKVAKTASNSMSGLTPTQRHATRLNDHYSKTVGRGDRPMPSMLATIMVLLLAAFLLRASGWLG